MENLEKEPLWFFSGEVFWELFKVRPVQFGALPAAAKQLFTKPGPGRGPNRTERRGSFLVLSKGKATNFGRTRGFSKLTRFRNTENFANPLC